MSEGPFPPNPLLDPSYSAAPRGVPTGVQDQVIVDIPKRVDPRELKRLGVEPEFAEQADIYSDADIEAAMAESARLHPNGGANATPFDQEAYDRAQAEAGNPADTATLGDEVDTQLSVAERSDLNALLTVGKRRGFVTVLGHRIDIETLNSLDEMNVGRYVKPYMDSPGFVRAWTVATAAAGVRLVDNQRIYDSLAPVEDEAELFDQKVRIMARYYPYAITPIYDGIQRLDAEFAELAEKLGKLHG